MKKMIFALILLSNTPSLAQAMQPGLPLVVQQESVAVAYAVPSGSSCLMLEMDGGLNEQDIPGVNALLADLELSAGPGVFSENESRGDLAFTYALVPQLNGNKLAFRGLLPSDKLTGVKARSKSGRALIDLVTQNLPGKGRVDLVLNENCD